jgi:hypothetical protein
MGRPRHSNPVIEAAVAFAEAHSWRWVHSSGHAWGRLFSTFGHARWLHHVGLVDTQEYNPTRSTDSPKRHALPTYDREPIAR